MSTKRIVLWTIAGVLVLAGVAVYFFNDPSDPGASKYFPKCPVYSLTPVAAVSACCTTS